MATLTGEQLKDSYQSLVTIGDSITSDPTSGRLENGKGTALTAVGIGTDTPDGTLHLEASDNTKPSLNLVANNAGQYYDNIITSTLGRNSLNFKNTDTTESGAFGGQISGLISFETSDTDNAGVHSYISGVADASGNGFLAFATGAGGSPTERLRIRSTGDISFRDGSASEAFYWDASAGSLGIGTTSPSQDLEILNGITGAGIRLSATNTAYWDIERDSTSGHLTFTDDGAGTVLTVGQDGKVGIGTTSPTEKLQIVDSANDVHVRIGSGNAGINPTLRFHGKNTADTTNVYADIRVNPDNQTLGFSGTGTSGGSIEQDALVINSSGNVGIGSDNPGAKLHVSDTGSNQFYLERTGAITGKYRLGIAGATNRFYITDVAQSADRVVILENGNVGIGTASPDVELDVDGEIRASNGILFGTDTATANALDDYEEGTWTPVYAPTTGSFTTMTMDVVGATYTKIGRQVTVRAYIRTDEVVVGTASGVLKIDGLPFSCATGGQSSISLGYIKDWSTAPDAGYVNSASSSIFLHKTNASTNSDVADLTTGAVANQNVLILNLTYFV